MVFAKLGDTGSVLGVDVGYSATRRSSAVCRIDWDASSLVWKIKRFRASADEPEKILREVAGEKILLAAAFDGPIRAGFDCINKYRAGERMLTRRLQPKIGKPGQCNVPVGRLLNAATNRYGLIVRSHCRLAPAMHFGKIDELAIVEAFPSSFLGLMLESPAVIKTKRGDRSDQYFKYVAESGKLERLIQFLLPNRQLCAGLDTITNHDDRAAFVCAVTALCVVANKYTAVGDDDGWIMLPPRAFIAAWGLADLVANSEESQTKCLHFN